MSDTAVVDVEVSVIVPVFNGLPYLLEQLDAVALQECEGVGWELVIADNGSTDGSFEGAAAWMARNPQVHAELLDASDSPGQSFARNAGARSARGHLLLFCDQDDIVADDWIQALTSALRSEALVTGRLRVSHLNARAQTSWRLDWFERPDWTVPRVIGIPVAIGANMGVRRELFEELRGFDEAFSGGEDVDFSHRAALAGHHVVGVSGAVVDYRLRQGVRATARQAFGYGRSEAKMQDKWPESFARTPTALLLRRIAINILDLARGRQRSYQAFTHGLFYNLGLLAEQVRRQWAVGGRYVRSTST